MSASEFDIIFFDDADTLAYIDPVPKPSYSLQPSSEQAVAHRIHSQKLLETGSPALQKLFDPKVQARNIERRGQLPEGITYIIDLTPPSTEDDAVLFLTELSCPLGIRTWANLQCQWELPLACVSGKEAPSFPSERQDDSGLPPEYSPSRHRLGIVHILQALEGIPPRLDTPCKFWTFFGLAKSYGIAARPEISNKVLSWVYESNNKRLVELYPEIACRLAGGIESEQLLRDAFSVLVGEEALLLVDHAGEVTGAGKVQATVHGRPKETLDDEDTQRVEYASKSFLEHVIQQFVHLVGTEMNWLQNSSMFRLVQRYGLRYPGQSAIIDDFVSTLKSYARGCIVAASIEPLATWTPIPYAVKQSSSYPTPKFFKVYESLGCAERIFTRTFWRHLANKNFTEFTCQRLPTKFWYTSLAILGNCVGAFRYQNVIIRPVTAAQLQHNARQFNNLLQRANPGVQPGYTQYDIEGRFSVSEFIKEVQDLVRTIAREMSGSIRPEMTYELTDTITCLTEGEYKYLPLWAGGNEDGTGGVFLGADIPLVEAGGFSAPGPSICTGSAASLFASSAISTIDSTIRGASHRATEGQDSEVISINAGTDNVDVIDCGSRPAESDAVDEELSLALSTSADEVEDMSFDTDSDSDDTVIGQHDDLGEFDGLALESE